MKITFQNQEQIQQSLLNNVANPFAAAAGTASKTADAVGGVRVAIGQDRNAILGERGNGGKSITELRQEAGAVDVAVQSDFNIVMAHTLSGEDYAKAQEQGFSYADMEPGDFVTIQDKVKAAVAQGGTLVEGYNDNLSDEKLAEILGSTTLAAQISDTFAAQNLPITEENATDIARAWELASALTEPTQATIGYMADNRLQPEIWNLYLAQSSGASLGNPGSAGMYALDVKGYFAQAVTGDETTMTPEAAALTEELAAIEFPITQELFAQACASAILKGESATRADLTDTTNIYAEAVKIKEFFDSEEAVLKYAGNLSARRQLEEVRLSMTAEVNVKLLKSGFSIDTAPMSELIERLTAEEKSLAARYFPTSEHAVEDYRLWNRTEQTVTSISNSPVDTLALFTARNIDEINIADYAYEAETRRDVYIHAEESYEALLTAPRYDLGDSIRKAFSNIPELTKSIGLEPTERNERAVRILGYNSMEISEENVARVQEADDIVCDVVRKMTPAAVLKMIRDGVNPLEKSFTELETYFGEQPVVEESVIHEYSRYLYNLDRKDSISEEEREAYIGIFRMLHKVQKKDYAAVGSVLKTGAELNFANLLTAVRITKTGHVDVSVDREFGSLEELIRSAGTITEQIQTGYARKELSELRQSASASSETVAMLEAGQVTESAENLLTATQLLQGETDLFRELSGAGAKIKGKKDRTIEEQIGEDTFESDYEEFLEEMTTQTEQVIWEQAEGYLDVAKLSGLHSMLKLASAIATPNDVQKQGNRKDYFVPVEIGGEISTVHLTVCSGENTMVEVSAALGESDILAHIDVTGKLISGYVTNGNQNLRQGIASSEVQKFEAVADIFNNLLEADASLADFDKIKIPVVGRIPTASGRRSATQISSAGMEAGSEHTDGADHRQLLKIAKLFLSAVKEEG